MTGTHVDDPADPRLEPYRDLPGRTAARGRTFVAESRIAVERLLGSSLVTESVVCTPARAPVLERVAGDAPLLVVPGPVLDEVVGFDFHRGCAAIGVRPSLSLRAMLEALPADAVRLVVAEGLADPSNLGALARNAAAFGVHALIVDRRGADPFSRRAIRASMGHVFTRPVLEVDDLPDLLELLRRERGLRALAAVASPDATPVSQVDPGSYWALAVGNEGSGLSSAVLAACRERVTVPIDPHADSLNVAAATAVLLHALSRV